jgi:urease accessory protein
MTVEPRELAGLMQLGSAALPIGAFSHSLGLESAVDAGIVKDADSAARWIGDYLDLIWARGEAPLWLRLYAAWELADADELARLNDRVLAVRESSELLLECAQTGHSLRLWLLALPDLPALRDDQRTALAALQPIGFACAHALAARALGLSASTGLHACAWGLLENLTTAAVKLVPLGQTQGQAILRRMALKLPAAIATAMALAEDAVSHFAPMLAIRSARHESQYSRLFRS